MLESAVFITTADGVKAWAACRRGALVDLPLYLYGVRIDPSRDVHPLEGYGFTLCKIVTADPILCELIREI